MRCEDFRDRLIDITSADLLTQELEVQRHLASCPACRQVLERTRHTWALLGEVEIEEPDSQAMRARFRTNLEQRRNHATSYAVWRWVSQAAALVLALGVGVAAGRASTSGSADVAAVRQELQQVREMLTVSMMQQSAATERIRGVSATAQLPDATSDMAAALIDTLLRDDSVNVRLACVRALERFSNQPSVRDGVARAVTQEESPLVSVALIDFIVQEKNQRAVDALRTVAQDDARDMAVRDAAARALVRLTGGRL